MEFLLAVAQNDIEKTRQLLQTGFDVNSPILWNAKNTFSPSIPADIASRPELLDKLQSDHVYYTRSLNIAVICGHAEMVHLLLSAGADINMTDGRGRTALICGIYSLDIDSAGINTSNLALISRTHDTHFLIMKKLLLRHPNLHVTTLNSPQHEIKGITPLCLSSYLGKSEIIELLLDDGRVDVNGTDSKNATALMYAARDGNFPIVQMLLSYGASPDTTDSNGWSAIQYAENNSDIIQICEQALRRKRPDISMIHAPANPIARYPVRHDNLSTLISSLPNCQASLAHLEFNTLQEIDLMDPITAPIIHLMQMIFLHSIKSHDHASIQTLLLWSPPIKRDCSSYSGALLINHHDAKTGLTAIHHAMRAKPLPSLDTIAMLYQAGADINAQTCYGRTALHHLARIGMDQDGKSWGIQKKSTRLTSASPQHPQLHVNSSSPPQHQSATPMAHFEESQPSSTSFSDNRLSTVSAVSSRSTGSDTTPRRPMAEVLQDPTLQFTLATPTVPSHLALCASLLFQLGAMVDAADAAGNTPLHFAAEFGAVPEVLETLIMDGNADLHLKNKKQQTPLDICKTGNIRLFMLALEKERKETQGIRYIGSYEGTNTTTSSNNNNDSLFDTANASRHLVTGPKSKPTIQSTTICGNKNGTYHHHHHHHHRHKHISSPHTNQKEKNDDFNQIDLDFETILNVFINYHTTSIYSINTTLAYMTKTILQSRKGNTKGFFSNSTTTLRGSQKGRLERTIFQLRYDLQATHDMFDQTEHRAEQMMRHYWEELAQVERMYQTDCEWLELQKNKVGKLYDALERMDGRFCQLEQDQHKLIAQVEHWRMLALRQLRWIEQHDDGNDATVKHSEAMDSICLDNLMQAMTVLSIIPMGTNDPNVYSCEDGTILSGDLDRIVQKTLQHTALSSSSSSRFANARMALEEKWHQLVPLLAKPSSELQKDGNVMDATAKSTIYWERRQQHLTASHYSISLKSACKPDPRSLNELELSFDILSTNLCEIQKDMDNLNTQSSHVMESKKHMYDTCLALEKELETLEKPWPQQQQKRTKNTNITSTTATAPLNRISTIVQSELDQVIKYTQTLFDRQCLLDQEAMTLKKEHDNIEHQLDAIKDALRQVRPPLLLQELLDRLEATEGEPMVYMKKDWQDDENLVAISCTEHPFEQHTMDLADESDSTSLSSSSSIFSSSGTNNNNSNSNATQMKNTLTTPLAIQCLLARLDASLYSLKMLAAYHLRRSRKLFLQVQVSLAQASEDVDDACNQMPTLYGDMIEVTQRVLAFETEMETVIQHRKEEIMKVLEVVDEVSIDNGISLATTTQKHQHSAATPPLQKHDTARTPTTSAFLQNQQTGIENDRDRQELILRDLERFQVFHKHLQDDVKALKKHQTKMDQRIRYTNASLIDNQVDRMVGQDDFSLLSVSGHLTELMGGIHLHDLGLHLNKNTTTISVRNSDQILPLSNQSSTITNTDSLSLSSCNNQPSLDRLSTVDPGSSRTMSTSDTNSQRISLGFSMQSTDRKRIAIMSTTTSSSLSSLSSYQQERILSRASTLRKTLGRKRSSPQHYS